MSMFFCDPALHDGTQTPAEYWIKSLDPGPLAPDGWACCGQHLPEAIAALAPSGQRDVRIFILKEAEE